MPEATPPLALSDEAMRDVFRYAGTLHPDDRGPFFKVLAAKLHRQEIGDGVWRAPIARGCRNSHHAARFGAQADAMGSPRAIVAGVNAVIQLLNRQLVRQSPS